MPLALLASCNYAANLSPRRRISAFHISDVARFGGHFFAPFMVHSVGYFSSTVQGLNSRVAVINAYCL